VASDLLHSRSAVIELDTLGPEDFPGALELAAPRHVAPAAVLDGYNRPLC
jgi:hypothetical protein